MTRTLKGDARAARPAAVHDHAPARHRRGGRCRGDLRTTTRSRSSRPSSDRLQREDRSAPVADARENHQGRGIDPSMNDADLARRAAAQRSRRLHAALLPDRRRRASAICTTGISTRSPTTSSYAARRQLRRLIITLPPRNLKSICASVAFPAFALGHDPTLRIVCASYAQDLAAKHARDCRDGDGERLVPAAVPAHPDRSAQEHRDASSRPPAGAIGSAPRSAAR